MDLRGGVHGQLGLVLTPEEHMLVSVIPYARSLYPGVLTIPGGTMRHEATRLTIEHFDLLRVSHATVELEKF